MPCAQRKVALQTAAGILCMICPYVCASFAAGPSTSSEARRSYAKSAAVDASIPEEVFYEGSGSQAELLLSLLLAATILYIPLTIASIGKRAWIKYKFTNKRVIVENTSPLFARVVSNCIAQVFAERLFSTTL
jgi:hypothetical protein